MLKGMRRTAGKMRAKRTALTRGTLFANVRSTAEGKPVNRGREDVWLAFAMRRRTEGEKVCPTLLQGTCPAPKWHATSRPDEPGERNIVKQMQSIIDE